MGPLGSALENPAKQQVMIDFFVNTVLPSDAVSKNLEELSLVELEKLKFIGPGDSFTFYSAQNKVDLECITKFLDKIFRSE